MILESHLYKMNMQGEGTIKKDWKWWSGKPIYTYEMKDINELM